MKLLDINVLNGYNGCYRNRFDISTLTIGGSHPDVNEPNWHEVYSNMFDDYIYNKCAMTSADEDAYIFVKLPIDNSIYFNSFIWREGNYNIPPRTPRYINVFGSVNNGNNYDIYIQNITINEADAFGADRIAHYFYGNANNHNDYHALNGLIIYTRSYGNLFIESSEFNPLSCRLSCLADDIYPITNPGNVATIKCKYNNDIVSNRRCSNNNINPKWEEPDIYCPILHKVLYNNTNVINAPVNYNITLLPDYYDIKPMYYTINSKFNNNLLFNNETGEISGSSDKLGISNYIIYAHLDDIVVPTLVTIITDHGYCNEFRELPYMKCSDQIHTQKCLLSDDTISAKCSCDGPFEWTDLIYPCIDVESPILIEYNSTSYEIYRGTFFISDAPNIEGSRGDFTRIFTEDYMPKDLQINITSGEIYGEATDVDGSYNITVYACNGRSNDYCVSTNVELVILWIYCQGNHFLDNGVVLIGTSSDEYQCAAYREGHIIAECPLMIEGDINKYGQWKVTENSCLPYPFDYKDNLIFYVGLTNISYFPTTNETYHPYYNMSNNPPNIYINSTTGEIYGSSDTAMSIGNVAIRLCRDYEICRSITKRIQIIVPACGEYTYPSTDTYPYPIAVPPGSQDDFYTVNCTEKMESYEGEVSFQCPQGVNPQWIYVGGKCEMRRPGVIKYNSTEYNIYYNLNFDITPKMEGGYSNINSTYILRDDNDDNNNNNINENSSYILPKDLIFNNKSGEIFGKILDKEGEYKYLIKLCNDENYKYCSEEISLKLTLIYLFCTDQPLLSDRPIGTDEDRYDCPDNRKGYIMASCPVSMDPHWVITQFTCSPSSFEFTDKVIFYIGYNNYSYSPVIDGQYDQITLSKILPSEIILYENGTIYSNYPKTEFQDDNVDYYVCNQNNCISKKISVIVIQPRCDNYSDGNVTIERTVPGEVIILDCPQYYFGNVTASCSDELFPKLYVDYQCVFDETSRCVSDNIWEETLSNATVYKQCNGTANGVMRRECNNGIWSDSESNCVMNKPDPINVLVTLLFKLISNILFNEKMYVDLTIKISEILNINPLNVIIQKSLVKQTDTLISTYILLNDTEYNSTQSIIKSFPNITLYDEDNNEILLESQNNGTIIEYKKDNESSGSNESKTNVGMIVGIVVGVVALIVIIAVVIYLIGRNKKAPDAPKRRVNSVRRSHNINYTRDRHPSSRSQLRELENKDPSVIHAKINEITINRQINPSYIRGGNPRHISTRSNNDLDNRH